MNHIYNSKDATIAKTPTTRLIASRLNDIKMINPLPTIELKNGATLSGILISIIIIY